MTSVLTVMLDHPASPVTGFHHRMLSNLELVSRVDCESHALWFSTAQRPYPSFDERRLADVCDSAVHGGPRRELEDISVVTRARHKISYGINSVLGRPSQTYPFSLRYDLASGLSAVIERARAVDADLIVLPVQLAHWVRPLNHYKVIIDAADLLSTLCACIHAAEPRSHLMRRASLLINEIACVAQERLFLPHAVEVWTTSTEETTTLASTVPKVRSLTIPNILNRRSATDADIARTKDSVPTIAFLGTYSYRPNLDAALELALQVFPLVRKHHSNARLLLAGAAWPGSARLPDGVEVVGEVNDSAEFLGSATVVCLPIRVRGGVPLKLIEAMELGQAIVATPELIEGLNVHHNQEVLVGACSDDLAREVVTALSDAQLRRRVGYAARLAHERYFSMTAALQTLELESVLCTP